jgi:hypothetical protein
MLNRIFVLLCLLPATSAFSWAHFTTQDKTEIRDVLRHHRDLLDDYLIHAAENPGTSITEAYVRYITVFRESGGEKVYTCEVQTELKLSDNSRLSDKVEVEKLCEHVF